MDREGQHTRRSNMHFNGVLLLQDTAIDESRQLGYLVIGSIQLYITLAEDSLARVFTLVETMKKDQHIKPKSRADTLNC